MKRKQTATHVGSGESELVSDLKRLVFLVSMVTVLMCIRAELIWLLIIWPACNLFIFKYLFAVFIYL
jgi:hypothetical protein